MLDRDLLRHDPERVRRGIARKGGDVGLVDRFSAQDAAFRAAATRAGELQAEANRAAKSIGQLMAQGRREEAEEAKRVAAAAKAEVGGAERAEREAETALREIELLFPNLPADGVPDGRGEEENVVRREWGIKPSFDFARSRTGSSPRRSASSISRAARRSRGAASRSTPGSARGSSARSSTG